jgi:hypothetical protein
MYDAYRCCTLLKMRMCARTSNIKITNTERKFTQERKVGHRGCAGLGNVVALRRKWQEALQMIQPSECTWPGVRGRQRGVLRGEPIEQELQSVTKKNWTWAEEPEKSSEKRQSPVAGCRRGEMLPAGMGVKPASQRPEKRGVRQA